MALSLWDDAKRQMNEEVQSWPYSFPTSEEFPNCDQRGVVRGRLLVQDRYLSKENLPGKAASVGLAAPGDAGSWQRENKRILPAMPPPSSPASIFADKGKLVDSQGSQAARCVDSACALSTATSLASFDSSFADKVCFLKLILSCRWHPVVIWTALS
ncbi:hypothetical protein KY285_000275 [Solanum tuberosum]|nr:hypothetical protein KY284_000312 [Solanum tuberosum]KAH0764404.1 hypothetical protein KY285_000275 [Solanum tuberosum]